MKKRLLAMFVSLCMAASMLPVQAFAEDEPVCSCTERCTSDAVNTDCPVCGVEGADLSACLGVDPPPEGEGDGRGKGRGLRAEAPGEEGPGSGQARLGTGGSPHAPEAGPPEHRPRGMAQGPPRGEWRAAPPVGRWPDRGAAEAAASAQERPASGPAGGAGRRQRTPANGGGCPCAPPCSPQRRPPEGASTGQAGHGAGARAEGAAARRARSCGPPTPRCKEHHPQGTASGAKGKRPGRGLDASGKENSWQSQPLAGLSYHSGGAAVKPPEGAAPYLILGHYSVRGAP